MSTRRLVFTMLYFVAGVCAADYVQSSFWVVCFLAMSITWLGIVLVGRLLA